MRPTSKNISIGSGYLYLYSRGSAVDPLSIASIPSDATIETDANMVGAVKDGANLVYKSTWKDVRDLNNTVVDWLLVKEELTFRVGLLAWNKDSMINLSPSAHSIATSTAALGGRDNANKTQFIIRFVTKDGSRRLTMVGYNLSDWNLVYQNQSETVLTADFGTLPFDNGELVVYKENLS